MVYHKFIKSTIKKCHIDSISPASEKLLMTAAKGLTDNTKYSTFGAPTAYWQMF